MKEPLDDSIPVVLRTTGLETFNLQPEEAFIFSRVNGTSSLKEIAQILGYDTKKVWGHLKRLFEAGFVGMNASEQKEKKRVPPRPQSVLDQLDQDEQNGELKKIPREKRKEILLFYADMATKNHYEVLGIPETASEEKIKTSYFRMVKQYHPDRFFGQSVGAYAEKLEQIFGKVTQAYEELGDSIRRITYDRSLAQSRKKKTETSNVEEPESKSQGKLTGKTLIERLGMAKRYFEMGREEDVAGRLGSAASFYQMAHQLDPKSAQIQEAHQRTKPFIQRKKADELYVRGSEAMARGDASTATALFEEALSLNPRKKECYRELAGLYVQRKASLARAKEMGLRAVELFQNDSQVRSIMGRIYEALGEQKLARKEFELSLKFDKENEIARRGLERLKG